MAEGGVAAGGVVVEEHSDRLMIEYDYLNMEMLRRGGFGKVYKITRHGTQQEYAVKMTDKAAIQPNNQMLSNIQRERIALRMMDSPYVVKLHRYFEDPQAIYFLLDLAENYDLYHYIEHGAIALHCVRFYSAEVIMALEYLRSIGFVHRDIKAENVLLDRCFHIKLTDFGSAKKIGDSQGTQIISTIMANNSYTGTRLWIAPEVLFKENVTFGTDLWNLAFMMYEMYTGQEIGNLPTQGFISTIMSCFRTMDKYDKDFVAFYEFVDSRGYVYPMPNPDADFMDLIGRLARRNPRDRLGVDDIQQLKDHQFFSGMDWENLRYQQAPGFLDSTGNPIIALGPDSTAHAPPAPPPRPAAPGSPVRQSGVSQVTTMMGSALSLCPSLCSQDSCRCSTEQQSDRPDSDLSMTRGHSGSPTRTRQASASPNSSLSTWGSKVNLVPASGKAGYIAARISGRNLGEGPRGKSFLQAVWDRLKSPPPEPTGNVTPFSTPPESPRNT